MNNTKHKTVKSHQTVTKQATPQRPTHNRCIFVATFIVVALVALFALFTNYYGEVLYRVQELNLFLYTPLFFKQQLVVPGGFLTWLGTYFTQYFYHPWLGALLLCLWLAVMMHVAKYALRVPMQWALLLLIPAALIVITDVDMGYWIYYLKLRGQYFLTVIATTGVLLMLWLYRLLPARYHLRTVWAVLAPVLFYPLMGAYALVAAVLMAVFGWRLNPGHKSQNAVSSALVLLSIVAMPLIFYRLVYYQTRLGNIYAAALPVFTVEGRYNIYYLPYVLLAVFVLFLVLMYGRWNSSRMQKPLAWWTSQVVLLVAVAAGTWHFWYKDPVYRIEIRMNHCVENLDWEGVLTAYRDLDDSVEPTRMMWLFKNLALFRMGRQGDEMYRYRDGAARSNAPFEVHMVQVGAKAIYYNMGQINFCYRWCLEDGVEYGWRIEELTYCLRCALLNGEYQLAQKYADLLRNTKYYKQYANKYQRYIDNHSLIRSDAEMKPILPMMHIADVLTSDNTLVELYLLNGFAHTDSKVYPLEEQAVLCAMQIKDIATFWERFFHFAPMLGSRHMPTHIQEAAYLYGHLENKVDISHMPFDKDVVQSYNDFMAKAQQCAGMSEDQMKELFYPQFGGTFYYDYFFIRNQKTY